MTAEALDRRSSPEVHPAATSMRLASGQAVAWTPWSAPVLLDERSTMILGLLDGEVTLGWLADEFSVAFGADRGLILTDLIATAQSFGRHGLLLDGGRLETRPLSLLGHDPNP